MKPITQKWIDKAEEDWEVALLALGSPLSRAYNAICFHAQQCAEKYLKGQLQEESLTVPKTHDLGKLLDLLLPTHPLWAALRPALDSLTVYAVDFRYPGDAADKDEAEEAVNLCRSVREIMRLSFDLLL
jgi:HEPN domain-containing protein